MGIAEVRTHILVIFGISAGGGNITRTLGTRLRDVAGPVGIGLVAALTGVIAGLVGAALILGVTGLVVGARIFCVGGFYLRFGFGEFVAEFDVRSVALVLIVLIVLRRPLCAFVLARVVAVAAFARTRVVAAQLLAGARPAVALAAASARGVALALALAAALSVLCVRFAGALILSGLTVVAFLSGLVSLPHRFLDALLFLFGRQLGVLQCVGCLANLCGQRRVIGTRR